MKIEEIAHAEATFSIDPDEARVLAAACSLAGTYTFDESTPSEDPFAGLGDKAILGALFEAYACVFEAAGMAAFVEDNHVRKGEREREFLSGVRKYGTGYRFAVREESEVAQ